jgi:hypothetical protein
MSQTMNIHARAMIASNTIDELATYRQDGGLVRATGPIGCTLGERISIRVAVRQPATAPRARRRCATVVVLLPTGGGGRGGRSGGPQRPRRDAEHGGRDGGPDEGTRGVSTLPRPETAPPGVRYDGGPEEGPPAVGGRS